jgi:hypothetical protein
MTVRWSERDGAQERPEIITGGVAPPAAHVMGITPTPKILSNRSKTPPGE